MTNVQNSELFFERLKAKLVSLGLQDRVASTVASCIKPLKIEGNTVIAECKNPFYRDTLIKASMNDIISVARECWGPKIEFYLRSEPETQPSVAKRRPKSASKNTSATNSLFDFPTQVAENQEPPAFAKKEQPHQETTLMSEDENSKVTLHATKNIDRISKTTAVTPIPVSEDREAQPAPTYEGINVSQNNLIQEFTFSTFVRGQSNLVAYSACEAVTHSPGNLTNPVFIYGATGLGKTHLLHSVGNEIRKYHPDWRITYVSSVDFMNELIASIRFSKQDIFRNKYRMCDVLLVDDIQFLESKESTQMEFFHTFNELYQRKKQIVITSDKYPKDIPNISERLKSRFVEGLIAEVEPPSYEDRLAIIEAKSRMMGLRLTNEIVTTIARHVKSNVREIQGVLNNLLMSQSMSGKPPTIESATSLIKRIVRMPTNHLDVHEIQKTVAAVYGVKLSELLSASRSQRLVVPRHIAMYLAKELLESSTTEIAGAFGKKDHTTVMHALSKVKELLEKDTSTRATVNEIKRRLDQSQV